MAKVAVVTQIAFIVEGRTRQECIEVADSLANDFLAAVGGEPWIMIDDDWHRRHIHEAGQPLTIADDQGFFYTGNRRYRFNGPFTGGVDYPVHEGNMTQKQVRDE